MEILTQINQSNGFLLNLPATIRRLRENQEEFRGKQESWRKEYRAQIVEIKREFQLLRELIENGNRLKDASPIKTSEKDIVEMEQRIKKSILEIHEKIKILERRPNEKESEVISSIKTPSTPEMENLLKSFQDIDNRLKILEKSYDELSKLKNISTDHNGSTNQGQQTRTNSQFNKEPLFYQVPKSKPNETPSSNIPNQANDINSFEQRLIQVETQLNLLKNKESQSNDSISKQAIDDLIKQYEERMNKFEDKLKHVNADLASISRQLTDKPTTNPNPHTTTTIPLQKDSVKELQAIMPFIEALPIFAMATENEWNSIY